MNKISSKKFNQVHDSLGALKLIASSLTSDSDILSSFCVLAFDEVPNRNFTTKEYISRKADAKNGLNLVQKHLIAKEVSKLLKDASAFYDSELPSLVKTQADFKRPENVKVFKTAKFGDVVLVGNKYHLVNPLTKTVTAEYIVLAADANFSKLHELIAKYRDEKDVKLTELDGQMVLTGAPEVINELEHLIKDIGYYCEAVDESTGVDGEIPEYSLKIFTNTTAAPEFDIEKAAAKHEKVGEDSKFSYWLQLEDNYEDDGYLDSKNVGDHVGFFYATEKGTQAPALLVSQLGFSGDGLTAQRTYPTKSKEPGKTYLYEEYGYTDDDFSEVYNFLNDGLKNVSPEMNKKNLDGLTVDNIDTTNPNLKKDNPMLNTEGAMGEVVEKPSAEKPAVEKKADEDDITSDDNGDEKAQAVSQHTGEAAELTEWTTYGLPTYKSGNEEYAVASDEKEVYNAVVEEVESILDDVGYDAFMWDNMGGIENFLTTDWFAEAKKESDDYYKSENPDEEFTPSDEDPVEWFINNFGKDALKDLIKEKKIKFDTHAIADEVIKLDGPGHVLSGYDGNEVTQDVNGKTYFLYRQAKKNGGKVEKKAEEKIDFEKELMEAGESKGKKDKVNKEQLEMGKKVEKEHTTNPEIAEKITRDHLAEFPDYYTHLEEMENNAKKNNEVKSSYAPFITIDATTTDEVKVVAGEKVVGTCKTIQAAFEKTADWSSEEVLIDDGTGVTVTYQVYDDESELPVVWAALRHRDNGNVIMCSDAVYVDDLLGAEDHIDFIKDIKDFSKEFAKVGLGEEKVQHYQDQTNAKLKEIFQSKPELGAQSSAKPEVKKEAGESYGWVVNSEDAWNKLMLWEETVGAEQALRDVAKAIGDEELSECLAYIFRMNDFKQGCSDTDEDSDVESSKKENIEKKADEELKQFDMKQELDGQKEFEKQDDFSQVSVPEEKEDTSEVTETMEAKPEETKGESFSASEFGNNMAYIQQNNPDAFKSIMNNLKQIMVGDQQKIYNFLENWSSHNFQDFTAMTREDPTYARHSQYQEQLKNNVLPKLKEMSEYKQAMEEKVSAEKGNVDASVREYDSSDPEDASVYNHNGEGEGEED